MTKEQNEEGRGFMPSAFLVAAVLAVMLLGMILRTGGPQALPQGARSASPPPSLPLGSAVTPDLASAAPIAVEPATEPSIEREPAIEHAPEPAPAPVADPLVLKLAQRAEDDCERLRKAPGRWTAQLLVACKPETVDRVIGAAGGASRLYVLPAQVKDDACFRVCYGSYASSKDAALASDLPKALRGKEKIGAVEIAKVLP